MEQTRAAVIGTAPSWNQCPWNDPDLYIVSLNDAYTLGVPRANAWYDTHPIDQMWFRPKDQRVITSGDVPPGAYIRPEGHIEWLRERAKTIPVWLHGDPPADWGPNARQ